jgi:hypothetical protein
MGVILRSPASGGTTKNLIVAGSAEILRGACPEPVEGLRMTWRSFRIELANLTTPLIHCPSGLEFCALVIGIYLVLGAWDLGFVS